MSSIHSRSVFSCFAPPRFRIPHSTPTGCHPSYRCAQTILVSSPWSFAPHSFRVNPLSYLYFFNFLLPVISNATNEYIQDVRWQEICSVNSRAVLLFRALHLMQTLYIQDNQMHNITHQEINFLCSYDVVEGRTTFENNIFGEDIKNLCKLSEEDEVKRFVVCRTQKTGI